MRIRSLILAALFVPLLAAAGGRPDPSPAALLGKWRGTAQHHSGATVTVLVQFSQNMKFTSSTTVNGNPHMEAAGTWHLSGEKLEWTYEQSSHPAIRKGFVDIDDVESMSANEIGLVSRLSGKKHRFQRVQ